MDSENKINSCRVAVAFTCSGTERCLYSDGVRDCAHLNFYRGLCENPEAITDAVNQYDWGALRRDWEARK